MNDALIIGSAAMKHHYPDFPRHPMDRDVIITEDRYYDVIATNEDLEYVKESANGLSAIAKFKDLSTPFEYFFADKQASLRTILEHHDGITNYATPEVLYSLKKSHIHYPIKFKKHIQDYMFLREKLREKYNVSLEDDLNSSGDLLDKRPGLTDVLQIDAEYIRGKLKTPKMNQTTKEFFGKSKKFVKSYYVHDDMHKAIAQMHVGYPVYEDILKAGSEVETDINKWNLLPLNAKVFCVLEEVYVIALERKILPVMFEHNYPANNIIEVDSKGAFDWALYRVCTTLCDGFFREFATRAYDVVQQHYNPNYVQLFFENISKFANEDEKKEEPT